MDYTPKKGTGILDSLEAFDNMPKKAKKSIKEQYEEKKAKLEQKVEDKKYRAELEKLDDLEIQLEENPIAKAKMKMRRAVKLPGW